MAVTRLDHIAITAPTLEAGVEYVRQALGVAPRPGGRHPQMGTHNCLLGLGPDAYLEVIAVDPGTVHPAEPRWFRLDRAGSTPRLAAWVARTDDLASAAAASPAYRRIVPFRRGDLRWDFTLPEGGDLVHDGVAPFLIQWRTRPPVLPDSGCTLEALEGRHPQAEAITQLLDRIGLQDPVRITPAPRPALTARIRTPFGPRILTSLE
jgi:hypothetical protein